MFWLVQKGKRHQSWALMPFLVSDRVGLVSTLILVVGGASSGRAHEELTAIFKGNVATISARAAIFALVTINNNVCAREDRIARQPAA